MRNRMGVTTARKRVTRRESRSCHLFVINSVRRRSARTCLVLLLADSVLSPCSAVIGAPPYLTPAFVKHSRTPPSGRWPQTPTMLTRRPFMPRSTHQMETAVGAQVGNDLGERLGRTPRGVNIVVSTGTVTLGPPSKFVRYQHLYVRHRGNVTPPLLFQRFRALNLCTLIGVAVSRLSDAFDRAIGSRLHTVS
jgi:hypothetical protein